ATDDSAGASGAARCFFYTVSNEECSQNLDGALFNTEHFTGFEPWDARVGFYRELSYTKT
ncbi:MAG: hypothetical protein ACRC5C_04350, partial [Bacilli bacterium]